MSFQHVLLPRTPTSSLYTDLLYLRIVSFFKRNRMASIIVYQHSTCLRPSTAPCLRSARSLITNSDSSQQTTTALFTIHKASSWTALVNPLIRIAFLLLLLGFNYRNESITGARPALIAGLCDGLGQFTIGAAGRDGPEQLAPYAGST